MSNTTEGTKLRAKRYQAKEIAKKHLDEWNDVTGFIEPDTGYYFELLSVMEDAMPEYAEQKLTL